MRNRLGVTLVEVMVVVAIIAILAAIAIPNFMRFQARSKQAEARTNLRAIYSGQTSRFSEKDGYTVSSGEIGFAPERGNRYSYDLGTTAIAAAAGLGFSCASMENRSIAQPVQAGNDCGVTADIFRYGPNIVPTGLGLRQTVTFTSTTSAPNLIPDGVGVNFISCPACDFAARAVGNVDNDGGGDEHFVSSQFGSGPGAGCAEFYTGLAPGTALFARNDVECD